MKLYLFILWTLIVLCFGYNQGRDYERRIHPQPDSFIQTLETIKELSKHGTSNH